MAVLSKEEFFQALSERVGTDTSESALSFIENMTDTYNHMENKINGSNSENWQQSSWHRHVPRFIQATATR